MLALVDGDVIVIGNCNVVEVGLSSCIITICTEFQCYLYVLVLRFNVKADGSPVCVSIYPARFLSTY